MREYTLHILHGKILFRFISKHKFSVAGKYSNDIALCFKNSFNFRNYMFIHLVNSRICKLKNIKKMSRRDNRFLQLVLISFNIENIVLSMLTFFQTTFIIFITHLISYMFSILTSNNSSYSYQLGQILY